MDDAELTRWLVEKLGSIDGWTWLDEGSYDYSTDQVTLHEGAIPSDARRAVGVRVYGGTDDDITDVKQRRVQLRLRGGNGDPNGANRLGDVAHTFLRGLFREGVISQIIRISFDPQGADANGREERTDNLLIIFDNEESPS
ncbi:MAG: minor capsid protein [Microbacterium enclense]